jgi:FkbM family methyltransferase
MLIDLQELNKKYFLEIKGVLHIGGHFGEEAKCYHSLGIKNAIFFEPLKDSFEICKQNAGRYGYKSSNIALGSTDEEVEMFTETANQGQSSSILKPALHLSQYPHIQFNGRRRVKVTTLDSLINKEDASKFNLINMDVQGYELEVLKGATNTLNSIQYIYTEVNREELYENCAMVEELDQFLFDFNFSRMETSWAGGTWGDALYIKK